MKIEWLEETGDLKDGYNGKKFHSVEFNIDDLYGFFFRSQDEHDEFKQRFDDLASTADDQPFEYPGE